VQYSANLLADTVDTVVGSPNAYSLSTQFDQRLNHNIFAWIRFSPVKKLQLETKGVLRIYQGRPDLDSAFSYRGYLLRPEFKLFSQELIPGVTLYGDYLMQPSDSIIIIAPDNKISTFSNTVNSSVLLIPGVWVKPLNFFQLNLGYAFANKDSSLVQGTSAKTLGQSMNQTYTIKPIFDFTQDLHFDSRLEKTNSTDSTNIAFTTDDGLKWYNVVRLAFRERKTRFDADVNMLFDRATRFDTSTKLDTVAVKSALDEFRIKWTERWMPTLRTESSVDLIWQNIDTTFFTTQGVATRDTATGYLNTITPGILFDWRILGKVIREWRTQYYIGAQLSNGRNYSYGTYSKAWQNKLDIQVKAGANFFLRMLLEVDYLFDQKVLNYNLAELKATALF
jgi:hypothetical protein